MCDVCHAAEQPEHKFPLKRCGPALCTFCHDVTSERKHVHAAIEKEGCLSCHDPHGASTQALLSRPSTALTCQQCHSIEHKTYEHGPVAVGDCTVCHQPHASDNRFLLIDGEGVQQCLKCHKLAPAQRAGLPTTHPPVRESCTPCHAPHSSDYRFLLRSPPEDVCLTCHPEKSGIDAIGHAPAALWAAGFDVAACQPCHWAHAVPPALYAALPRSTALGGVAGRPTVADRDCALCHRAGGPAPPPMIATHPNVPLFNPFAPDDPGYLPLFNERGEEDAQGVFGCRTCHLTHGRSSPAPLPRDFQPGERRELRARRWHLRSFVSGNLCTLCHGSDGRRRFLYFHDAARARGAMTNPREPATE